ncbi:hypothetical protein [Halobacterium jilantaiense]|nr:hypothetical protein [Halobacterium jilantaiense]
MHRRRADAAVAVLVETVVLAGAVLTWRAYQQRRVVADPTMGGSMMDGPMVAVHGPSPLYPAVGTLFVVAVLGGAYLFVRRRMSALGEEGDAGGASP